MTRTKKSEIPKFRSYEEEAHFWETHDSTEFINGMSPAKLKFPKPRRRRVSIQLPESEITGLRQIAARKGVDYLTLLRIWVAERLLDEMKAA